jgi:hypothetical protein
MDDVLRYRDALAAAGMRNTGLDSRIERIWAPEVMLLGHEAELTALPAVGHADIAVDTFNRRPFVMGISSFDDETAYFI